MIDTRLKLGVDYLKLEKPRYKYILLKDLESRSCILTFDVDEEFFSLSRHGLLLTREGYCWDGASGPMPDFPSSMRGSRGHDPVYQMLRRGLLPYSYRIRKLGDIDLYCTCREDRMNWVLAQTMYRSVRAFGRAFCLPPKG